MKDEDVLLDKVVKKTNVNKGEILKLANDLQSKDLNNENDIYTQHKAFINLL